MVILVFYQSSGSPYGPYGHPNGPLIGPCETDISGPLVKKSPQGSLQGLKCFSFIDLYTTDKLIFISISILPPCAYLGLNFIENNIRGTCLKIAIPWLRKFKIQNKNISRS